MQKTFTMIMNETKNTLVNICNESQLPTCVLELMVKELYEELHKIAENQLQQDMFTYNTTTEVEVTHEESDSVVH